MCGLPSDVYQLGHLRRLIFLVWTTLRSLLLFLDNPPKPFSLELPHALTPISLGCPSAYEMHCDAISITHITHANISPCIYSHNLNHTIMLCNFTFPHSKNLTPQTRGFVDYLSTREIQVDVGLPDATSENRAESPLYGELYPNTTPA